MIVMGVIGTENLEYEKYTFPDWSTVLGWMITLSSILIIPAYALYRLFDEPGSLQQVRQSRLMFGRKTNSVGTIGLIG